MPEEKSFVVDGLEGGRLDKYLAVKIPSLSRSYLRKLIDDNRAAVNGRPAEARHFLKTGDAVRLDLPDFSALPPAEAKKVPILHEDKDIVVVDKPAGWVVHPAGPHQSDTLIQRLWPKLASAWASSVREKPLHTARPGVVHRLDKGTSGVIVIAKTPVAADSLSRQFAGRKVEKIYWALVHGLPGALSGTITSTVGRDRRAPHRMSVTDPGRPAELEFKALARFEQANRTLMEVHPRTGRTHQIRVQLASVGHPLVGDVTYGAAAEGDDPGDRPMLHALRLSFAHPRTGKALRFEAPLPADFKKELKSLGFASPRGKKLK